MTSTDMGIPWGELSGEQTERIVATLLCLKDPTANRIRAAQGDGGVDVIAPCTDPGAPAAVDVYQVKAFASGLGHSGRRAKIRHSLATLADGNVDVATWWLTIPLDPTLDDHQDFLAELNATVPFQCKWFGLAQIDGLAAQFPEVGDYYLRGGMARVESNIRDLLALQRTGDDLDRAAGKLLSLGQLVDRLDALSRALNREDPHFVYELQTTRDQPVYAPRNGLLASVTVGSPSGYTTVHVLERFDGAAEQRPPSATKFLFNLADMTDDQAKAVEEFFTFGSPLDAIPVTDLEVDLPAGLGGTHAAAAVWIAANGESDQLPFRQRLIVSDPAGAELASAVFVMDPATVGIRGGARAHGFDVSGAVEIQISLNPTAQPPEAGFGFTLSRRDLTGRSPSQLLPAAELMAAFTHPNRFAVGHEHGPPVGGYTDIPEGARAPLTALERDVISALADLQRNLDGELVVPDLATLGSEGARTILIAGALARRMTVKDTWTEQSLETPDTGWSDADPQQVELTASHDFQIGEQTVTFHGLRIHLVSTVHEDGPPTDDGTPTVLLRPGEDCTYYMRWDGAAGTDPADAPPS